MTEKVTIRKADGSEALFDEEKVLRSMARAHVPENLQQEALNHLKTTLFPNISTKEIYAQLFDYIKIKNRPAALKYSLKNAIQALGPSGFPFEKFVARIYEAQGFETETNVILNGDCVEHEIDVIAKKEDEKVMAEVKFHNHGGVHTDLKVALYVWARFQDVETGHHFTRAEIVTNTKLTESALRYVQCKAMRILGWNYPAEQTLPHLVEQFHLHPITALSEFSQREIQLLIDAGVVLCRDLTERDVEDISRETGVSHQKLTQAHEDVRRMFED